ncbi:hypothetical protein ACVWY2_002639 [Bradyrhizobium sp. JR6.1]
MIPKSVKRFSLATNANAFARGSCSNQKRYLPSTASAALTMLMVGFFPQ